MKKPKKSSEYEKVRRDKLNESFAILGKLLPDYDPSITLSKSEILQKASGYIKELQEKVTAMGVQQNSPSQIGKEVKTLYERIRKLLQRNQELCLFINDVGIKLPKHYSSVADFRKLKRWMNRFTPKQVEEIKRREAETQKENQEKSLKKKDVQTKKRKRGSAPIEKPKTSANQCKIKPMPITEHVIITMPPSEATSQPCLVVTSTATSLILPKPVATCKSAAVTVLTSSPSSSTPKVSSIVKPPQPKLNVDLNALGPGTLIMPDGSFLRLLPQPAPIIIKPPAPQLVVLTTTTSIYTKTTNSINRPKIQPLKTVYVNRQVIPAFMPHRLPKRKTKVVKRKSSKIKVSKPNEAVQETSEKVVETGETTVNESAKDNNVPEILNDQVSEILSEQVTEILSQQVPEILSGQVPEIMDEQVNVKNPETEIVEPAETEVKSVDEPVLCKETAVDDKTNKTSNDLELGMNLNSELSNDIFSSLQVPIGSQNPESTSPTAAFLLAFPLVSSLTGVKVTEVIEEENSSSHNGTPTLLQIGGTMEPTKTTESLTPNLLNLDNFSFFSGYSSFDYASTTAGNVQKSQTKMFNETPARTSFSCVQETTSVTYSTVGSVSTPYVHCQNHLQDKLVSNLPKCYAGSAQCNAFNVDFSKPSYSNNFSKSYTDPVYTNSYNNYNQNSYNNNQYYATKSATNNYQHCNYYNAKKDKFSPAKNNKTQPKPPINWMTTPDFRGNSEYVTPAVSFPKEIDYALYPPVVTTQVNYFNHEFQQQNAGQFEENQFSWSPSKLPQYLETAHNFVSTTLPTLIGDLALGTTQSNLESVKPKDRHKRVNPGAYDTNPSNFLSVSQLVEHKTTERVPRRNGRNVKPSPKVKKLPETSLKDLETDKKPMYWMDSCSKPIRQHSNKNSQNYSAEALIGDLNENLGGRQRFRQNFVPPNKTLPIPTYLSENIVPPYFPPVEITQENFVPSSNHQNYHQNFSQNAGYLPDFSSHDFNTTSNRQHNDCSLKKHKHKPTTNENPPMDFGFLSMPSSINSPILPDDFHAHTNFLSAPASNQLYPCKNPLYPKQSSTDLLALPPVPASKSATQQFENMPGSSLTNFNLSAIFPEMNKGSGMYSSEPTRNKNYNFHYLGPTVQTTFHNKSTAGASSYINSTITTFAPTN